MVSQYGNVVVEVVKNTTITRNVEVDGKVEEKKEEIGLRFDFSIPIGSPYDIAREALADIGKAIDEMEETSKKRAEEYKAEQEKKEPEA